jgi:hypothetical protein
MGEQRPEAIAVPDEQLAVDDRLHDPAGRRLLCVRGQWEVRSPPGPCALGPAWLVRGMWHLQFFAPMQGLSILAFQSGCHFGPFVARASEGPALRFDDETLDQHLVLDWGLAPCSHQMRNLVHLMEDKALACVLRMRAGAIAAKGNDEQTRRRMA